ncbi:MAG TPA: hypothetical protein DEF34_13090 [Desulfotomaculum sp.]|nr:hypothetical protein [Desulfotomaculum sp.]
MRETVIEIAAELRRSGWPISTGEIVDFFKALQVVDFSREDMLAAALCTLAKDKQSREYLAEIINHRLYEAAAHDKFIPCNLDPEAVLANPPRLPNNTFAERLVELKGSIRREIMNQTAAPARRGPGGLGRAGGQCGTAGAKRTAASLVSRAGVPDNRVPTSSLQPFGTQPAPTNLRFIDLANANPAQLDEIKKLLGALGKKLAVKRGYRKKPSLSGTVDMQRTVRKAVTCGGVPLVLKKERRVPASPLIVTLCDLSGSVAPYSEFFLQLFTGLRCRFKDMRSYAFVDRVAEVTGLIKNPGDSWSLSARQILREAKISLTGFSDYGQVWECFHNRYRDVLTPRTTVIILGDARNNWRPDGADIFRSITGLCRRTIWLNPLPREKWDAGDCIISAYAPYCSSVQECRNAFQLSQLIRNIL